MERGGNVFLKSTDLEACVGYQGQVLGGGEMVVRVRQTVRIGKMSPQRADLFRFLVHPADETAGAAADMLGHRFRRVVAGDQHEPEQQFAQR